MKKNLINFIIILLVLNPILANAHFGHKHIFGIPDKGYDNVNCSDPTHHLGLNRCKILFHYNQTFGASDQAPMESFEEFHRIDAVTMFTYISTPTFGRPAERAPPFFL